MFVNAVSASLLTVAWMVIVVDAPTARPMVSPSVGSVQVTSPPSAEPSWVQVKPLVATGVPTMDTESGSSSVIVTGSAALALPILETVTVYVMVSPASAELGPLFCTERFGDRTTTGVLFVSQLSPSLLSITSLSGSTQASLSIVPPSWVMNTWIVIFHLGSGSQVADAADAIHRVFRQIADEVATCGDAERDQADRERIDDDDIVHRVTLVGDRDDVVLFAVLAGLIGAFLLERQVVRGLDVGVLEGLVVRLVRLSDGVRRVDEGLVGDR